MRGDEGTEAKGAREEWQSSEAAAQQQRSAERNERERRASLPAFASNPNSCAANRAWDGEAG